MEHNDDVSSLREERSRNRGRGARWYDPFGDLSEAEEALDLPHSLSGAHGVNRVVAVAATTLDCLIQHIMKKLKQSKISLIGLTGL